ncbi:MAG: Clostripain family protein [Alistipes sp.]|nr:Clostripain family protein [Alistipes sp.]
MIRRSLLGLLALFLFSACSDKIETPQGPVERTVLMFFPWAPDLSPYTKKNIADMESVVAAEALRNERLLVFSMTGQTTAELFELRYDRGRCVRVWKKDYTPAPDVTSAEGIAAMLGDLQRLAPASRFAMTIGCHGMAWLPARSAARAAGQPGFRYKEYWEYAGSGGPLTRWFGGSSSKTDIAALAEGIRSAGMKMDFILFDDCYMASAEVAFALRGVTDHLVASTSEVMAAGFPYAAIGPCLVGQTDYGGVAQAFFDFYSAYEYPYGTVSTIVCSQLDALAEVMARINERFEFDSADLSALQRLDGYSPVCFFDLGDYVRQLCSDPALLAEFETRLEQAVPAAFRRHTPEFYSMSNGINPIRTFSGITVSDPSVHPWTVSAKLSTEWWQATHR